MSLEVPKFDPQVFLQVTLRWDSEDKEVLTQLAARIDKEVWQDPDHPVGVNRVSVTDAHLHGVPSYLTLHAPKSLRKEMLAVYVKVAAILDKVASKLTLLDNGRPE